MAKTVADLRDSVPRDVQRWTLQKEWKAVFSYFETLRSPKAAESKSRIEVAVTSMEKIDESMRDELFATFCFMALRTFVAIRIDTKLNKIKETSPALYAFLVVLTNSDTALLQVNTHPINDKVQVCAYSGHRIIGSAARLTFEDLKTKTRRDFIVDGLLVYTNVMRCYRFAHFERIAHQHPFSSPETMRDDFIVALTSFEV